MTIIRPTFAALTGALILLFQFSNAQSFIGELEQPLASDSVMALNYHGEYMDMTGGYAVGDTVVDFQIFNLAGESVRLYDLLENDKPVVLFSGSATCVRFCNFFKTTAVDESILAARSFMDEHSTDIEWLFIYGVEAHPGDLENCTSNCPPITIATPNGDTLYQHTTYGERQAAVQLWGEINSCDTLDYEFNFPMALDNPSNEIYNRFFARPFGTVVLNCGGVVQARGDWGPAWLGDEGGIEFLSEMLDEPQECDFVPFCFENSLDSDGDGICDQVEINLGYNPNDPCNPDNTDSDEDGVCDQQEILDGTDPFSNDSVTGVNENGQEVISVYPNPVSDVLTINANSYPCEVLIRDLQGKLLHQETLTQDGQVHLDTFLVGTYLLEIQGVTGDRYMKRIVKN